MANGKVGVGPARTTVRLRRRVDPDVTSGTLAVLAPATTVEVTKIVGGSEILTISDWAALEGGGFCWSGGLEPDDTTVAGGAAAATSGGFVARAVAIALAEWDFFGNNTQLLGGAPGHNGHHEDEVAPVGSGQESWFQRVGDYWLEGTDIHGLDGRNRDVPWSAAFISYVMLKAGAGTRFRASSQHSTYISQAIRDRADERALAGYWAYRISEEQPTVGDLVCWSREDGVDFEHQKAGNYKSHTDLVVAVRDSEIDIVGGNVGQSVTRRPLSLQPDKTLSAADIGGERLFAIMRCRIA